MLTDFVAAYGGLHEAYALSAGHYFFIGPLIGSLLIAACLATAAVTARSGTPA